MNRGSAGNHVRFLLDSIPSMRPRFMNRGSYGVKENDPNTATAFNEAPIHESGK